ncbi:MAG: EAL domain-containing protein [Leptolyngbya sp. SIO1D8]|nr:EAL domain-containing protein [Leptolyngbya sp. SIO1D8]
MTPHSFRQLWRLLPGSIVAIATIGLTHLGMLTLLEHAGYRWLFQLRGILPWDERIALITIDDATLAELGQFPLPRDVYTQLLKQLETACPITIAFNILFIEPSPADAELAEVMAQQGNVIIATSTNESGQELIPTAPLQEAVLTTGHTIRQVESDGLVHTVEPVVKQQTALGITMAQVYALTQAQVRLPSFEQRLQINWPGSIADLPQYSLADVLAGRISPDTFDGKFVLIGMTATGTDALLTPFDDNPPSNGILLHAAVLDNVLQQRYLRPVATPWFWGLLLFMMPGLSYVLVGQHLRWQLAITGCGLVVWLVGSLFLFHNNYLVPTVTPMLLLGLTGTASILGQRLRENLALQRLLDDLWQHYRQDALMLAGSAGETSPVPEDLGDEVGKLALLAESLGRAKAAQATIAEAVPIGMLAVDEHDQVWFCNPLATRWLGLNLGEHLTPVLVPDWLTEETWQNMRKTLLKGGITAFLERKQEQTWFELRFEPLNTIARPSPILPQARHGFLILIEDITHRKSVELQLRLLNEGLEGEVQQRAQELELKNINLQREILERQQAQEELTRQALYDELTGLPNRYHFMTRLTELLERPQKASNPEFAVLFLDCDRFKLVNDSFGHLIGDALLKAIAKRLRNCIAQTDMVARFGGDEFTILLTNIHTPQSAIHVAQRIQQRLQEPFLIQEHQLYTGCSTGIVIHRPVYSQAEEMLRDADIAMYHAKQGGLGYALFKPEMHVQIRHSLQLEIDLRQALKKQEFSIHYQPIFTIGNQKIVGFEALLRWQHPTHGNVSPSQFIPIAEETGLIVPIGQWVLKKACAQLRDWQKQHRLQPDTFMSINLSVRQFKEANLIAFIENTLRETGLESQYLKLEIIESVLMSNADIAIKTFQNLKEHGIHLGIDDFGTGYSSLNYLHYLPIDILKVDRSFIKRISDGRKYLSLVQVINTLAYDFDITMIAEGIENEEQLQHLKAMGCLLGQGNFLCPPIDCNTLETEYLICQDGN